MLAVSVVGTTSVTADKKTKEIKEEIGKKREKEQKKQIKIYGNDIWKCH